MTDSLLQMGLSNACFALLLAIVAMFVGKAAKRPQLAHLLWLLVFVKLVTPPIVPLRVLPTTQTSAERADVPVVAQNNNAHVTSATDMLHSATSSEVTPRVANRNGGHSSYIAPLPNATEYLLTAEEPHVPLSSQVVGVVQNRARAWLPHVWVFGSMVVLARSLVRVCRFNQLLRAQSEAAPGEVRAIAARIARRLKLKTVPEVLVTSARLSPMVWWTGGMVRVVVPRSLLDEMPPKHWQWILAHELAHVRRRDYWVRWIEWLACVAFWWNPVVWWAQRNLRAAEEICCDALVLSILRPKPRVYANSLLTAVEFLAGPVFRPPAMASEINSGGFLERRFSMIVSNTTSRGHSRWLRGGVLLCAAVVLPLGFAQAQDFGAVAERLEEAVEAGELSAPQAKAMLGTLKKMAAEEGERNEVHEYLEEVWTDLQAAVKRGRISQDEAERKMAAIKGEKLGHDKKDLDYKAIGQRIEAALKAGKITEEEAKAKWAAIKKMAAAKELRKPAEKAKQAELDAYLTETWEKLQTAVKRGRISREDAAAKMAAIKKEKLGYGKKDKGEEEKDVDYQAIGRKIREALAAGKITKEEARAKWAAIQAKTDRVIKRPGVDREERDGEVDDRDIDERLRHVGERIHRAVEDGSLSEDEGWAKWNAVKSEIVKDAVRSGKISREEAGELLKEIKKGEVRHKLELAIEKGELDEDEAEAIWDRFIDEHEGHEHEEGEHREDGDRGIEGHFSRLGISGDAFERVVHALSEADLNEEQIEGAMGGMLRIVHQMKNSDAYFTLNPEMRHFFAEQLELSDRQIKLIIGLAHRLARGSVERGEREHAEQRQTLMRRLIAERDERAAKHRAMTAEIREAVEAGRISAEDAERKLAEIRQEMFERQRERNIDQDNRVRELKAHLQETMEAAEAQRMKAEKKLAELHSQIRRLHLQMAHEKEREHAEEREAHHEEGHEEGHHEGDRDGHGHDEDDDEEEGEEEEEEHEDD